MDALSIVKKNYLNILLGGVFALCIACIFAFIDFSKTKAVDYVWRGLSITCFIIGLTIVMGLLTSSGYGRYCKQQSGDGNYNSSDIEVNPQ
ncbi:IMv membrane protein [Cetacean poxvirus 1]|nr:IMv membrane protein [Cetacean poxvirus 1]